MSFVYRQAIESKLLGQFLQATGAICLSFTLAFVVMLALGRARFKFVKSRLELLGGSLVPAFIELVPAEKAPWKSKSKHKEYTETLKKLGFRPIGLYEITPLQLAYTEGFFRDSDHLFAGISQHPLGGMWLDFFCILENGMGVVATNSKEQNLKSRSPQRLIYRNEGATVETLLKEAERLLRESGSEPNRSLNFQQTLQESYHLEAKWQYTEGIFKDLQIDDPRIIGFGLAADEKTLDWLKGVRGGYVPEEPKVAIEDAVREFLNAPNLSNEQIATQYLLVHDELDLREFRTTLEQRLELPEGSIQQWEPDRTFTGARNFLYFVTKALALGDRLTKEGEVSGPLLIEIYTVQPASTASATGTDSGESAANV